jgi:hypothetical protein
VVVEMELNKDKYTGPTFQMYNKWYGRLPLVSSDLHLKSALDDETNNHLILLINWTGTLSIFLLSVAGNPG